MNRVIPYVPEYIVRPPWLVSVPTAWNGCESILFDIMKRFNIFPGIALEFGVDYAYSTAAIANYFNQVIGVDHFQGDVHAGFRENLYEQAKAAVKDFKNIELIQSDFRDFISKTENKTARFDMCHVDVVHNYRETNDCVAWCTQHSDVVLAHDTIAFPEVRRSVQDVCWETGFTFYEYQVDHGLAILVK